MPDCLAVSRPRKIADRDPYYDGRTVFILEVARVRPEDIILTRNRRNARVLGRNRSALIAVAGRSNFSHASICSQPPTLIEAIGPGVSTMSLANTFYHSEAHVRVLRYSDEVTARRAAAKAVLFLGKGYFVAMAVKSVLPARIDPAHPAPRLSNLGQRDGCGQQRLAQSKTMPRLPDRVNVSRSSRACNLQA
jgi:hypothetical protein